MIENNKNNLGFTIIELLVSVAILGVFISLVFGTIFYVNKSNEAIKTSSNMQNDIRSIFDSINTNIKENGINYEYYRNGSNYNIPIPTSLLVLNNDIVYRKTNNCYSSFSCIEVSFNNGNSYQRITSSILNINRLDFYFLRPDPNNYMPIITTVLSGQIQDSHKKNYDFSYQNTVEFKNYIKQ